MKKLSTRLIVIILLINILSGCALALGIFGESDLREPSNSQPVNQRPKLLTLTVDTRESIKDRSITQTEITITWKKARDPEIPQDDLHYVVYYIRETDAPEIKSPDDLLKTEKDEMIQIEGNPDSTEIGRLAADTSYRIFVLVDNTKKDYALYTPVTLKTKGNQESFEFEDSKTSLDLVPDFNETEAFYAMAPPESEPFLYQDFTITADIQYSSTISDEAMIGIIARAEKTNNTQYKGYLFRFSPAQMGIGTYRNNDNTFKPLATKKFSLPVTNTTKYSIKASIKSNHLTFGIKTSGENVYSKILIATDDSFQAKGKLVLYSKNARTTISNVKIYSSDVTTE